MIWSISDGGQGIPYRFWERSEGKRCIGGTGGETGIAYLGAEDEIIRFTYQVQGRSEGTVTCRNIYESHPPPAN